MYINWYKVAQTQKEAGLKEVIPSALLMALLAVMGGSTIWSAAQRFKVEPDEIENALSNDQIVNELQQDPQSDVDIEPQQQRNLVSSTSLTQSFIEELKDLEGSKRYQRAKGYFRNNKFYPYKDSRGFPTIGYGHLILSGENFQNGISEQEADNMLLKDATTAVSEANQFLSKTPVTPVAAQIIANMVFQMGYTKVNEFKDMWSALQNQDYQTAADEMIDSKWYKQTPNRAKALSDLMRSQ